MNYDTATDPEINHAVRLAKYGEPKTDYERFFYSLPVADYCNNPADMDPIIEEHKIGSQYIYVTGKWLSSILVGYKIGFGSQILKHRDKKRLRSAAIVYLKMEDAK